MVKTSSSKVINKNKKNRFLVCLNCARNCVAFWDKRGIPIVKPLFPLGNLNFYFFTKPMVIALDPEIIKDIFVRDFSNFSNRGMYFNEKKIHLQHIYFQSKVLNGGI